MSILCLDGNRETGDQVRTQNVNACLSIANIVKSSLGPIGLDKILVDEVGDVTITNDGATILKLLDVQHPAAKVMVDLACLQESEVGDGTTSVVLFASELMKEAEELITNVKIHPTTVIAGFKLACKEAIRFMNGQLTLASTTINSETLMNAVRTSISSKIIGSESDFFSKLIVDAVQSVKITEGKVSRYPVKSINILKAPGKSMTDTVLINGYALNCTVASQACVKSMVGAKIACIDFSLQKTKMKLGVKIIVDEPKKLDEIRKREFEITHERVVKILASGANVLLTSGGVDDAYLKYFIEGNAMVIRRVKLIDLKRIAKVTGATVMKTLSNMEGNDVFETSSLGYAESVIQEQVGDEEMIVINNPKLRSAASLIIRGPNYMALDEVQRAMEDGMYVVKRTLESNKLVAGGAAVETACSIHLENFADSIKTKEQTAINAFAKALLIVPQQLCLNAGKDVLELVSKLRACHYTAQSNADRWNLYKYYGLNLVDGDIVDNVKAGVLEPYISKSKMLKFSTEVAMTILRIDDMIRLNPEPKTER